MRISVVIPSFNRAHSLPRALQSVFQQTSAADEVIVVDDGSTDASSDLLARDFPEVEVLQQPNRGVSAARNRGIEAAQHDWIALLDSDDSWLPEKLECIREAQRQHPGFVLYHSDEIWMRNGVRVNPMHKHEKGGGWIFERCLPLCAISPSATVINKSTLVRLGLFDETLPACEDYDLWLRLCHRYPVHYLERALITKYGGHQDQLSRQHTAMDRFRVYALHRLLSDKTLRAEYRDAARAMLTTKIKILMKGAQKHRNQALIDELTPLWASFGNGEERLTQC